MSQLPLPKWARVCIALILFTGMGFLRDFLFVNINAHLYFLNGRSGESMTHSFFGFLNQWSFAQVYYVKYPLTFLFVLTNFALSWWILQQLFSDRNQLRWLLRIYLALGFLAAISFGIGFLAGKPEEGYAYSRIVMGILQSPVAALVLVASRPLYTQSYGKSQG